MRWKFWKKAAQPELQQQLPSDTQADRSLNRQKKRRHFEASCIAGADTGDEDFIFESFERRTALPDQRANLQPPQPPSPPLPPTPPPPRKKESHTLPRFLRRAASVGRSKGAQAEGTNGAASGSQAMAGKKAAASSDEGFPSASSGDLLSAEDDSPLAYCPHCRAVVQPLTVKKRSQIRTNPWLKERKRPRIQDDGVMQKSLDSGISGLEDASARTPQSAEPVELTATAAQTDELGVDEPGEFDESPGSAVNSDSDGSSTPILNLRQFQPKRKVLRKRRHRRRQLSPEQLRQQQQQQEHMQQQQCWEAAYLSSDDEDLAADAEVLAIHASAYTAASQPLSIMAEGIASAGFVPEEQKLTAVAEVTPVSMSSGGDSSSLWWDMDRRYLRLMMAPPPDTSSCSSSLNLTEAAACQTPVLRSDSEGTEFDSPADSDSEMEFELPPQSMPLKSTEESLADAVRRLAAQRDSLDRRFRDIGEQSRRSSTAGGRGSLFARELELYRRELLLRALASVRDQLDYQMLRLEQRPPPAPSPPPQQTSCLRQASDPNGRRLSIVRCGPGERMSYH